MSQGLLDRRSLLSVVLASAALPAFAFAQNRSTARGQEVTSMRIRLTFGNQTLTAALYDNLSAHDLASMLPLDLTIDDYAHNEKIAYLPRKLTEEGSEPFSNEQPGDLCYYKPWGNLAMFHGAYKHSGLIRLGRFDDFQPLLVRGEYPLRIERVQ